MDNVILKKKNTITIGVEYLSCTHFTASQCYFIIINLKAMINHFICKMILR